MAGRYAHAMSSRSLPGRDGILDAAARRFLEAGYAETSVRDIAADVGVKDELLATILDEGIERITATVQAALAGAEGADPAERLRVAMTAHLAALFEHGPYTAAHVGVFPSAPDTVRAAGLPARTVSTLPIPRLARLRNLHRTPCRPESAHTRPSSL